MTAAEAPNSGRHRDGDRRTAVPIARVTGETLDFAAHLAAVQTAEAGATASFCGVVRNHDAGREVTGLEYHGHPTAPRVIAEIGREIAERPGVIAVAVSHRLGTLEVGDMALVGAVSAAHRAEAFDACRDLVERVKHELPVWKRQLFVDGSEEWVGSA